MFLINFSDNLVSFDNLTIRRKNGVVRSVKEYYPYGLEYGRFNGSFSYNAVDMYNKGYTSATWHELEWKYEGLDLNYFAARYFDPIIGRWHAPDPLEQCHSPYAGMVNDPANFVDPDGRLGVAVVSMAWCGQYGSVVTVANTVSTVSQGLSVMGGIMNFVSTCAGIVSGLRTIKTVGEVLEGIVNFIQNVFDQKIIGSFSEKRDFRRYEREIDQRLQSAMSSSNGNEMEIQSLRMQQQTVQSMRNGSITFELRKIKEFPSDKQAEMANSRIYADPNKNRRNGRIIIEYTPESPNVSLAGAVSAVNLFQSRQITISRIQKSSIMDGPVWDEVDAEQFVDARNSMRMEGSREVVAPYIKEIKGQQISLSTNYCRTITRPGPNWGQQDCSRDHEMDIEQQNTQFYIDRDGSWSSPAIRQRRQANSNQ